MEFNFLEIYGKQVMAEQRKEFDFDNRLTERHIRSGRLGREELSKYLSDLPDISSKCDEIEAEVFLSEKSKIALTGEYLSSDEREDDSL